MILLLSLQVKSPYILARAEWKRAIRVNCTPRELQEQDLYNVLADCTVLLAKSESILATWDVDVARATHRAREVEGRGLALLAQLCAWRRCWDDDATNATIGMSTSSPSIESKSSPLAGDSMPSLSTATEGLTLAAMVELMLFDLTLSYLLQILASLPCQQLPGHAVSLGEASAQDVFWSPMEYYASQERRAAMEASRCVRSFLGRGSSLDPGTPPVVH